MDMKHFGDSYDIVKKSLIDWLVDLGSWSAHPMFTHDVSVEHANQFARFLGIPLLSQEVLQPSSDRLNYFEVCNDAKNVFLDPDTGLSRRLLSDRRVQDRPHFLFFEDLQHITRARPQSLTLMFDQSLSKGMDTGDQVRNKLKHLSSELRLTGFAYVSHASFIVVSYDVPIVQRARYTLLHNSGLPGGRITDVYCP